MIQYRNFPVPIANCVQTLYSFPIAMSEYLLVYILLLPLLGAVLAEASGKWKALRIFLPVPALLAFILLFGLEIDSSFSRPWVAALGLDFSLTLHGLGWLLGLLVSGIGALIILYAKGYMGEHAMAHRLCSLLYLFMFAMLGVSLSEHMLLFFIFWELTGITSYFLIGFNHDSAVSRRNALQALLVTGLGGMALLAAFMLMAHAAGTWSITELEGLQDHPHYLAILGLVLLGAFTKSAQFPFHFWLPNAMAAPTPVSAYLHSATMVKAGVFLLALLHPVLGHTAPWFYSLTICGGLTLLLGGLFGIKQHDHKAVLAGTTLAALGLITFLLGIGSEKAVLAGVAFLLAHALYKAPLFMVAGSVDHGCGTRDLRVLGNLGHYMPWTAGIALLAALSKMGMPPLFGFISKEYAYKAGLAHDHMHFLIGLLVVGSALMVALGIKAGLQPFWFKAAKPADAMHAHEASWDMGWAAFIPAVLGLYCGIFPSKTAAFLSPAVSTAVGKSIEVELKLWSGFNRPLLLSGISLVLGLALYTAVRKRGLAGEPKAIVSDRAFDKVLASIVTLAVWQTRTLQSGFLRRYLLIMISAVIVLITMKVYRFGGLPPLLFKGLTPLSFVICILIIGSMFIAIRSRTRLTAIVALGAIGFCVALIFAIYSAPDLAITQILVETLTVVFFAWVVNELPSIKLYSDHALIYRDAVISAVAGLLVTFMLIKSQSIAEVSAVAETYSAWSLPKAYGSNVVNVILVDFRALDTWGEISVLAIAALGVSALLAQFKEGRRN